jgi:hypothetical protein
MARSVDPRQGLCQSAAGCRSRKTEIAPSDPAAGGIAPLARQLDRQLLSPIKKAAAATCGGQGFQVDTR